MPYQDIFGGATAFTGPHFRLVNGFSNQYYGWGGEDDDIFKRYLHLSYQFSWILSCTVLQPVNYRNVFSAGEGGLGADNPYGCFYIHTSHPISGGTCLLCITHSIPLLQSWVDFLSSIVSFLRSTVTTRHFHINNQPSSGEVYFNKTTLFWVTLATLIV